MESSSRTKRKAEGCEDGARATARRCEFDIRSQCFICGSSTKRLPNKSRERLTEICTGTGESTWHKVMDAAKTRGDSCTESRMLLYRDLFAFDAKYHRTCYSHYISERNIKAAVSKLASETQSSDHDKAFSVLTKDIEESIMCSNEPNVLTLAEQHSKFSLLLQAQNVPEETIGAYKSWKLKQKLKKHFCERISFIARPGFSDLICSSSVTVGDALRKASALQDQLNETHVEDEMDWSWGDISGDTDQEECVVLHRAAGILRRSIAQTRVDPKTYPSSCDIDSQKCRDFVPNQLYDFVRWISSETAYHQVKTAEEEIDMRAVFICHSLLALSQNKRTPLTLMAALYIHHSVGSKQLIDAMYNLGQCVSYDEVRRFLSSVAVDQISRSCVTYVPQGIQKVEMERSETLISAAIDNFDTNEETLDGKHTTHSMAAVLYQSSETSAGNSTDDYRLLRTKEKVLCTSNIFDEQIMRFPLAQNKPEPPVVTLPNFLDVNFACVSLAVKQDLLWILARWQGSDRVKVPAWTSFNATFFEDAIPTTTVRYLPFVRAPPTDLSTIYTTLLKLVSVAKEKGQPHVVVTADLGIYSKAQQVVWSNPRDLCGKVTMRLGGMHLLMAYIASIGKLFGDGGVTDLLISANIYAPATARLMQDGKHLNRGVRGLKLLYEALARLFLSSAQVWCAENNQPWVDVTSEQLVYSVQQMFTGEPLQKIEISTIDLSTLETSLQKFRDMGRSTSATFKFWDDFIQAVGVMLRLIRAERSADFELHLSSICEAIPYFVMADRQHYARYAPIYIAEMRNLQKEHPVAAEHLKKGGFVVRRSNKHGFNCVPTDQALEQTVNRDAKSCGGVIGFTMRKAALTRWLMTRHVTAAYSERFGALFSKDEETTEHSEAHASRLARDSRDVTSIVDCVEEQFENPFDLDRVPTSLVNIVTGQVASKKVEKGLSEIVETGRSHMMKSAKERLIIGKSKCFWDRSQKLRTPTFSDMRKCINLGQTKKVSCSSEVLFRRLLAVSNVREIDLKDVLQYELAGVPPALFNDDGTMRKTNKSDLAKKLESLCEIPTVLPSVCNDCGDSFESAYIIDGMALFQSLNEARFKTFNDITDQVVRRVKLIFGKEYLDNSFTCVVLVFDRYDKVNSVKSYERSRRGASGQCGSSDMMLSHQIIGGRDVPNYRVFLKSSANKAALAAFVCDSLCSVLPGQIPNGKRVILAGGFKDGTKVMEIKTDDLVSRPDLSSTQEEADTRMILHCINLAPSHKRVVVRSDDTDVLVLLLYYHSQESLSTEVFMHAGHAGKLVTHERFIPIHDVVNKLGTSVCRCLPAMHSLTGCDTTNALFRIGKRTALRKLIENIEVISDLRFFGLTQSMNKIISTARSFVLQLYKKKKQKASNLNELRYIVASTTDSACAALPPTDGSFRLHALRAHLQTVLWQHSHTNNPPDLDPTDFGWNKCDDSLFEPTLNDQESAPVQLRSTTHLFCKDTQCLVPAKCPCLQAGLACIDLCSCDDCPNGPTVDDASDEECTSDCTSDNDEF